MVLMQCFCGGRGGGGSDFLYKSICCGYKSMQFKWVPTTLCLYKEEDKKYTGCNLKIMELLDCALIGACAVIRSNTLSSLYYPTDLSKTARRVANTADVGQMLHNVSSDLDLYCLLKPVCLNIQGQQIIHFCTVCVLFNNDCSLSFDSTVF